MNKIIFFCIAFLSAQINFAKTTIISGHFDKPKSSNVTLQYRNSLLAELEHKTTKLEITLDKNNSFVFEIETDAPLNFHLLNGDKWLMINKYAAVGDSIYFDFKKKGTDITARCEACLAFDFEWEEKFMSNRTVNKEFNSSYSRLEPIEFSQYWSKRRRDQLQFFTESFKDKTVPDDFKNYIEYEINYDYAVAMLQYTWRKKITVEELQKLNYFSFLDSIRVDNQGALTSGNYIHFLRELAYSIWKLNAGDYTPTSYYYKNITHIRDSISKKYFTGESYDIALYQILSDPLRFIEYQTSETAKLANYRSSDSLISIYSMNFNDPVYAKLIRNKLEKLNAEPKPAPDFALKNIQGKEVKLSDFKEKVVYLDFWSTTCVPCVAEVKHANALKQKFDDKDVVFLYVSLDNSLEKLNNFIAAKSFNGIHLVDTKGFASDVAVKYEVNSLPHYFLIDKNGNVVNGNAPRPSDHPEELIETLLKK